MSPDEMKKRQQKRSILSKLRAEGAPATPDEEAGLDLEGVLGMTDRATDQAEAGVSPEDWQLESPGDEPEEDNWRPWKPEEDGGSAYSRDMRPRAPVRRRPAVRPPQ